MMGNSQYDLTAKERPAWNAGKQVGAKRALKSAKSGRSDSFETRVRYGYRRVHVLLRREGWDVNPKRFYRLYKEMGLQLRNKVPKRRVKAKLRDDRTVATSTNQI